MVKKNHSIQIKRKTFIYVAAILIALASVTPVLADFLGPNRTVTETGTSCKVILLSCQYVPSKDFWKYKTVNSWSCSNESKPWEAYSDKPSSQGCFSATKGDKYWDKVQSTKSVTVTYDPATITGSLQNCSLNNDWCTTSPQLSLIAEEPVTGYNIIAIEGTLNGQNFACANTSCSVPLPEGENTLKYWALSSWGDSSEMETTSAKVDSQPPVLAGTFTGSLGSNGWYVSPVQFDGSASDATSGLASFTCSLDGVNLGSCTSIPMNSDGSHKLVLTASDNAGNIYTLEKDISIDTKSPVLTAALEGVLGSNNWYNDVLLHVSATDPAPGSGLSTFEYNIDSTSWQTFPASGLLDLPEGKHSVDIRALDTAGHSVSSSKSFAQDSVAPDVLLEPTGSLGANNWYVTAIDLSASASDTTSGMDIFEYSVDNQAWATYTTPLKLADGSNPVSFWAQDKAGLVTQVDRLYQVDTRPPQIAGNISGTPGANGWYISNVVVSASSSDPLPGSGVDTFTYILDGAVETPYTTGIAIPDGAHKIQLNVKDKAGLIYSLQQSINVDTIRPSLLINTSLPNWIKGNVSLSGIASDNGSGISKVEISLNGGQSWQPVTGTTSWNYEWDTLGSSNGAHNVIVRVIDQAGLTTEQVVNVSVDNESPSVSLPSSWLQWQTITLDIWDDGSGLSEAKIEISDPNGRWTKRVIDLNSSQFPLSFKWDRRFGDDTVAPNGTYNVKVIALDKVGNTTNQTASVKVIIDVLPPGPTSTPQPYSRPTSTSTPAYTATPTSLPTATPTAVVSVFGNIDPTIESTPTPINPVMPRETPTQTSVLDWLESVFSFNGDSTEQATELDASSRSTDSRTPDLGSGVLWGTMAAAMAGAATSYVLEEKARREEEEARERAQKAAEKAEKAKNEAKLHAQKMEKLEAKWAQEAAWEQARLENQKDFATVGQTAKIEREEEKEKANWISLITASQRKAEEKKREEELKDAMDAYYSARKQAEKLAAEPIAEPENWWEKTKSFINESILQPLDEYVYEPIIEPVIEEAKEIITVSTQWVNTNVYQPYIAPAIDKVEEEISQGTSWLSETIYQPYVAPVIEKVTEEVSNGFSWVNTNLYQPYIAPAIEKTIQIALEITSWLNENVYQPYLQPVFAAIGQSIIQPYIAPFLSDAKDAILDVTAWVNTNIYEPYIEPVANDINQYIYAPLVDEASEWWSEYGEWVHGALDAAGFIPGLGEIADGLNGLIYLGEGKYIEASVSLLAMLPILGDLGKAGKWGLVVGTEVLEEAAEQVVKEVTEELVEKVAAETAENLAEEVAEELAEKVATETAEEFLEKTAKEAVEEVSEKILKETGEELVSDVVVETVENTVEMVVKETTDDVIEQVVSESAEQVSKVVTESVAEDVVEKTSNNAVELISSLTTKLGDDVTSINKVTTLLQKYGDDAVNALASVDLATAQKMLQTLDQEALDNVIEQGADAFITLSRWSEDELVEHGAELALRATRDADALKAVKELIELGPIDPNALTEAQKKLIEQIAENSIQNPDALKVVLGQWLGLDSGFIQQAMESGSLYYNPHPDVWNLLKGLGKESQEQVAWLVNEQVIQTGVNKGLPFEYTLNGIESAGNEMNAIEAVFSGETEEVIKKELMSDHLPFRMKELQKLKDIGFELTFDSINNSYILIKP